HQVFAAPAKLVYDHLSPACGTPDEVGDQQMDLLVVAVGVQAAPVVAPVDRRPGSLQNGTREDFWRKPTHARSSAEPQGTAACWANCKDRDAEDAVDAGGEALKEANWHPHLPVRRAEERDEANRQEASQHCGNRPAAPARLSGKAACKYKAAERERRNGCDGEQVVDDPMRCWRHNDRTHRITHRWIM